MEERKIEEERGALDCLLFPAARAAPAIRPGAAGHLQNSPSCAVPCRELCGRPALLSPSWQRGPLRMVKGIVVQDFARLEKQVLGLPTSETARGNRQSRSEAHG